MVACHPDAPTVDHLMIATRLMVAENVVDDCYCEDHGGSPVGLGGRLLLAHTALDALHTTKEYAPDWEESLHSDAPRRAYRSAMEYFTREATASQADRYRHDMARLHLGYLAEAAWAQTDYVPQVWEYLAMRQFNNFRPCPTITDTVGGYELPHGPARPTRRATGHRARRERDHHRQRPLLLHQGTRQPRLYT